MFQIRNLRKSLYLAICIVIGSLIINILSNVVVKANVKFEGSPNSVKRTVVIDPGHGGIDGGAVSKNGTVEKDINLKISLKLKKYLEEKGFSVVMTRETDIGLYSETGRIRDKKNEDLQNRCALKGKVNPDIFVSIHLNMFPQSKYYGAQVWYSKVGEEAIIGHMIQQNLIKDLNNDNTRIEKCAKGAYKLLRCYDNVPSILVECGFLSNPDEEEKLKSDTYQEEIAKSIAGSIDEFFKMKDVKENQDDYNIQCDDEKDKNIYDELDNIYEIIE